MPASVLLFKTVIPLGDINADISDKKSLCATHIIQFSGDDNFILSNTVLLLTDSYTYISEAWHRTSWLDHCISTAEGCMSILYGVTTSDHISAMLINAEHIPVLSRCENSVNSKFSV